MASATPTNQDTKAKTRRKRKRPDWHWSPRHDPPRLDGYVRVSQRRGREGESYISPSEQETRIRGYAQSKGWELGEVWIEEDESGANDARPKFLRAIESVKYGHSDGIIVAKLDRFARSVTGAKAAIEQIQEAGGQVVSVAEGFDMSQPYGRFAATMMLAMAELELDRIRENWQTAQRRAVERGVHIASRSPTGYRRVRDATGTTQPLELDPKAAEAVAEVFRRRALGASLRDLAAVLMKAKVRGPYDNNFWTAAALSKLLANPVYYGQARSGEYVKEDAHPKIVTKAEWEAARNAVVTPTPHKGEGALLSGILRCAGCRYLMKPDKMNDRRGGKLRIYRCRGEHSAGLCQQRASVLGHLIEPYVVRHFFAGFGPGGLMARPVQEAHDLDEVYARLQEAEEEHAYWLEHASAKKMGIEKWDKGEGARAKAVVAIRREIDEAISPALGIGLPDVITLREVWDEMPIKEQRQALALALDAVMLRGGRKRTLEQRVHFFFRGQAPDDLPRRGFRPGVIKPFEWPEDNAVTVATTPF